MAVLAGWYGNYSTGRGLRDEPSEEESGGEWDGPRDIGPSDEYGDDQDSEEGRQHGGR